MIHDCFEKMLQDKLKSLETSESLEELYANQGYGRCFSVSCVSLFTLLLLYSMANLQDHFGSFVQVPPVSSYLVD